MSYEGSFDVVIEGVGAERNARVLAAQEGLYVNQHEVPYSTLLGVALRGSILLVVGTQQAMALRGGHEGLAALAAELRGQADLDHLALADREALKGERVVFATPVAMSGMVEMERYKGMALVVVTDSAFHVFERGGRHTRTAWERVTKVDVAQAKFGRLMRIGSGSMQLEILYLTDAQIQTIRGLTSRHAGSLLGVADEEEVRAGPAPAPAEPAPAVAAPTTPAEEIIQRFTIPEFEVSLGAGGGGSDRPLGAAIDRLQMSSVLPVGFLEEHLRELRAVYEGPLLKAKREAAAADDVFAAARALEGRRLWDGLLEAVEVITDATIRAFERQVRRVAANRRIPWRKARRKFMPELKEISGLRQRFTRGVLPVEEGLREVTAAAGKLEAAAEADAEELEASYGGWQEALRELDQKYASGWAGLSREVVRVWQETLLPRLTRLGGQRRKLLPRPVKIALYTLLVILAALVVYLVSTGGLGQVIQFE